MDKDRLLELTVEVKKYAKKMLKTSRFEHSLRVAEMAKIIAKQYSLNEEKAYFSGLAHDICKNMSNEELLFYGNAFGQEITELEAAKPSLLHGKAAAIVLKQEFNVDDEEILQAVAYHTFGEENLCDIAKIIFVADKIEPERPQSTDLYRANLLKKDLNNLVLSVVEENIQYLLSKGKQIVPANYRFQKDLINIIEGKK